MLRSVCYLLPLLPLVASAAPLSFEKDVRPVLKAHCTHCHGEDEKPDGGVDLRLRRFMDLTLDSGDRLLVPGKPEQSALVHIIRSGEMPKKGSPMPEAELAIIERWIREGAKTLRPEPLALAPGAVISEEDRAWWAFQPVQRPAVPKADPAQVRTPVDAFLLAKLSDSGQGFAPEADRRALIRRLSLDLTGLLPTPEEVETFVADRSPLAYEPGRTPARLAGLWRTLGTPLARRRRLRR